MQQVPYLSAVGALIYLAVIIHPVTRFSSNPGVAHWKAAKHLFHYLEGTIDLKLTYSPNLTLIFSDADYDGCKDSGQSTGGYLVKFGTGSISWHSKLQPFVALSTTEVEYIAAVEAGKEMLWMCNMLKEFGFQLTSSSVLQIDNQSYISVAKNLEHHGE
jgi:hypothetical protein